MKYKGRDDTIADKVTDRVLDQAGAVETESFQIWIGRVVSTGSYRKRLAE